MINKITFYVYEGNILGYIDPRFPQVMGILQSKLTEGARYHWTDGPILTPTENIRKAHLGDFEDFNVCAEGYLKDSHIYDLPPNPHVPCFN